MSNERQQRAARAEQMRKEREKADRKQRNVITVVIVVVVVALIAAGGYAIKKASDQNTKTTKVIQPKNTTKDYGIVYDAAAAGGKAVAGAEPVKVELYEDFQCPICKTFEDANGGFLDSAVKSGEITIVYKPFSFLDENGGSTNRYSHRATNLAMCALDQGGVADFKSLHDAFYANQPDERTDGPEDRALIATAKEAGITGVDSCVKSERFVPWIDKAKDVGSTAGVKGTPTVRIDGKDVTGSGDGVPQIADIQKAIDAAKKS